MEQRVGGVSSDDWYKFWWQLLQNRKETNDSSYMSKENAEWRARDACKEYQGGLQHDAAAINLPVPACTLLMATDSSVYVTMDFPDFIYPNFINYEVLLPEIFGRDLDTSAYDGGVIFRSPWTEHGTRIYRIYPLRDIEFSWEEADSGVRDKFEASLQLSTEVGQTERFAYGSIQPRAIQTAVVSLVPVAGSDRVLLDLTDGSEWSVPGQAAAECDMKVGASVSVLPLVAPSDPQKTVPSLEGPCGRFVQATFTKGWE